MELEIIMSCMHEKDMSIVERSNIKGNVLIVNQCDHNEIMEKSIEGTDYHARMICTTERGLSKSRNMCIDNAQGDILQISDDDEWFEDDYQEKILRAYEQYPQADVILFKIGNSGKGYPKKPYRMGRITFLRSSSWQISFKRKSVVEKGIRFDEMMGSGTGNGGGEETMFVRNCLDHGLWIHYVPEQIASLDENSVSQWFDGFNEQFFFDRGWATRRFLGWPMAIVYAVEYAFAKRKMLDIPMYSAIWHTIRGIFSPKEKKAKQ